MENAPELKLIAPKKRRMHFGRTLPPPENSACMYVQIAPHDVGMFRFLLEAEDNLGYMSVADRWSACLKVVFSPHQEKAMRAWLKAAAETIDFKEIWLPRQNNSVNSGEKAPGLLLVAGGAEGNCRD
ncbi:MAG: DUF4911 domain-containing protein [Desulfovibrionaceae bacterium]|nr:DUF4911 domain-containing protein [Desulfovibrionaceae bacterium]